MTDALSPLVLNPGGESRVLPLMAVLEHLNGHTSLTGETRQDRINAQRRERYATDAEHREVRKTAARDRKRTLWATSPEYRERRRASRVAAYYRAKCRPSAYGLMGVWEGLA